VPGDVGDYAQPGETLAFLDMADRHASASPTIPPDPPAPPLIVLIDDDAEACANVEGVGADTAAAPAR